jgi:homogentisate 1,2-dioxygenase
MFESRWVLRPTRYALEAATLQKDYHACWRDLPKLFRKP